eukprot:TRINITY_DN6057_c0_g1_i2.p1 TRINITY_DN6057_c0_g1~~TRINITY_DN6057_c0_g1_i2.p1  ORF type:complete len:162 (+),score=33.96 TRINITY_DN6057_c0_g1_i2:660-1145(+)
MIGRLKDGEERIKVLPCLQEISRQMDTLSITPPYLPPTPSWVEREYYMDLSKIYNYSVDVTENSGNKPILSGNGLARLMAFNEWLFGHNPSHTIVIVCGHSNWFRSFFRVFLARDSDHKSKISKIANCGVIGFTIYKGIVDGTHVYKIDEESISVAYKDLV